MAEINTREDLSHDIRYPSAADSRGSARITYARRPYYLGPFDSAQSYIMFGLWKQGLQTEGKPPTASTLRPVVEELLNKRFVSEPEQKKWKWLTPAIASIVGAVTLNLVFSIFFPSFSSQMVDGHAMTESEMNLVRGVRNAQARVANIKQGNVSRVAERYAAYLEERKKDEQRIVR